MQKWAGLKSGTAHWRPPLPWDQQRWTGTWKTAHPTSTDRELTVDESVWKTVFNYGGGGEHERKHKVAAQLSVQCRDVWSQPVCLCGGRRCLYGTTHHNNWNLKMYKKRNSFHVWHQSSKGQIYCILFESYFSSLKYSILRRLGPPGPSASGCFPIHCRQSVHLVGKTGGWGLRV